MCVSRVKTDLVLVVDLDPKIYLPNTEFLWDHLQFLADRLIDHILTGQAIAEERYEDIPGYLSEEDWDLLDNDESAEQREAFERGEKNPLEEIDTGVSIRLKDFGGFNFVELQDKINFRRSDYFNYEKITLEEVIGGDISFCNPPFEVFGSRDNAIFIPLGKSYPRVVDADQIPVKHKNYVRVILDAKKCIPEYLACYLNSSIVSMA